MQHYEYERQRANIPRLVELSAKDLPRQTEPGFVGRTINRQAWAWFNMHRTDTVRIKVFGFPLSVKIEVLRPLFVMAFGSPEQ